MTKNTSAMSQASKVHIAEVKQWEFISLGPKVPLRTTPRSQGGATTGINKVCTQKLIIENM
jgi:hypothetical protein